MEKVKPHLRQLLPLNQDLLLRRNDFRAFFEGGGECGGGAVFGAMVSGLVYS